MASRSVPTHSFSLSFPHTLMRSLGIVQSMSRLSVRVLTLSVSPRARPFLPCARPRASWSSCVVVAGRSGAGKSTTAVELARRGHPILSDDKTVVQFDADGTPMVLSGYPTTRLWEDAVERMGTAPSDLAPLREDARKYLYEVPAFQTEPAPLRAIFPAGSRPSSGRR